MPPADAYARVARLSRDEKLALLAAAAERERRRRLGRLESPPPDGSRVLRVPTGDGGTAVFLLSPDDVNL